MTQKLFIGKKTRRPLVSFFDLPKKEQQWFDYVEGDSRYSLRFFSHKGSWYDLYDGFDRVYQIPGFDAAQADSYTSGIAVACPLDDRGQPDDESIHVSLFYYADEEYGESKWAKPIDIPAMV